MIHESPVSVVFGVLDDVPHAPPKSTRTQKREHDKNYGGGTMSRSGVACPCCSTIMTMEYIRQEALASRLATTMTAVVVDGKYGKEYRLPTHDEVMLADSA